MGIELIKPETFEVELGGAVFTLRRLAFQDTHAVWQVLAALPEDDRARLPRAAVMVGLVDWRGVTQDGAEVPFSVDLIDLLPAEIGNRLAQIIQSEALAEDERKNAASGS